MIFTKILVIYPQDTFTKIAIYKNINLVFLKDIKHHTSELKQFKNEAEQYDYRKKAILRELDENEIDKSLIRIVIARGGLIKPLKSGIYSVNSRMLEDLKQGIMGHHPINLGGMLADGIAALLPDARAFIADPVVVDELSDLARLTGHPLFERKSIFHALNQKHIARTYSRTMNVSYEEQNYIITHIGGGGVSVAAHYKGKVIDVNNAFDGDGPFAISRTGTLPVGDLVKACFSGEYSEEDVLTMISTEGGIYAHLGTKSIEEIDKMISDGDEKAIFILNAMAYQIAKEIGAMFTVLKGEVDAILLTGEMFSIQSFANFISERVEKFSKTVVYPLVDDVDSLAENGIRILRGEAEILEYE